MWYYPVMENDVEDDDQEDLWTVSFQVRGLSNAISLALLGRLGGGVPNPQEVVQGTRLSRLEVGRP
jgi:hypothetical protein